MANRCLDCFTKFSCVPIYLFGFRRYQMLRKADEFLTLLSAGFFNTSQPEGEGFTRPPPNIFRTVNVFDVELCMIVVQPNPYNQGRYIRHRHLIKRPCYN